MRTLSDVDLDAIATKVADGSGWKPSTEMWSRIYMAARRGAAMANKLRG